jgi:hypothetical protein
MLWSPVTIFQTARTLSPLFTSTQRTTMSLKTQSFLAASPGAPGLLSQIGMAGGAAVITVSFIHPIDVVKVRLVEMSDIWLSIFSSNSYQRFNFL